MLRTISTYVVHNERSTALRDSRPIPMGVPSTVASTNPATATLIVFRNPGRARHEPAMRELHRPQGRRCGRWGVADGGSNARVLCALRCCSRRVCSFEVDDGSVGPGDVRMVERVPCRDVEREGSGLSAGLEQCGDGGRDAGGAVAEHAPELPFWVMGVRSRRTR